MTAKEIIAEKARAYKAFYGIEAGYGQALKAIERNPQNPLAEMQKEIPWAATAKYRCQLLEAMELVKEERSRVCNNK